MISILIHGGCCAGETWSWQQNCSAAWMHVIKMMEYRVIRISLWYWLQYHYFTSRMPSDFIATFSILNRGLVLVGSISCSGKSRLVLPFLVLPFWYLLTWVVPDKFQKSSKTIVCVCVCVLTMLHLHSHVQQMIRQPQPRFSNRRPVESGWMLFTIVTCDNVPDVDIVCFGSVNRSPVGHSTSTTHSWLCGITVNQPECG